MSWAADVAKNGYLALQDFDGKVGSYVNLDDHRLLTQCSRYENDPREPIRGPQEVRKTKGPLTGGMIWDPEEFGKNPPFWSFVFPSEAESSKEVCVGGEDLTPKNTTVERRQQTTTRPRGGPATTAPKPGTKTVSPQTHTNGAKFKAIKGSDWKDLDPNRLTLEAATPEGYYPVGGWPGIMIRGTDQQAQHNLFCPAGGALIAPHFGGSTQVGTPVFDVDAGKINQKRRARLQSLIRTYQYPAELTDGKDPSGVAIQLSRSHCAIGGQGIVADDSTGPLSVATTPRDITQPGIFRPAGAGEGHLTQPGTATVPRNTTTVPRNPETTEPTSTTTTVAAAQVLAALSVHNGGFIDVGDENDQHLLWTTPGDGEKINSAHISTKAYFRGGVGDGPIEFSSEPWIKPTKGPVRLQTEIQWDGADKHPHPRGEKKGKWKLITYGNLAVVPPRDPETPPEDGTPPPDTSVPPRTPPPRDPTGDPDDPDTVLTNPDPVITGDAPYGLFVVGAMQEIAAPATVGRPQLYFNKAIDTRNLGASPTEATVAKATKAWVQSPVVIREEYVGQQKGPNFVRTTRDRSRYRGFGTAYGGKVYYPPEWGAESNTADPSTRPSSVARVWYWKDQVRLCFGCPDFTSDSVGTVDGYEIYKDSSHVLTFIETDSDASAISTQTLQKGVSGQIALVSETTEQTGNYTAAAGDVVICKFETAATITLPASPVTDDYVVVKRAAGAQVTVSGNGNNVEGDTSIDLLTEGDAVQLKFDGTEWWVI